MRANATVNGEVNTDTHRHKSRFHTAVSEKEHPRGKVRWTRLVRQFGGLAKVDRVGFYAANFSVISTVA